MDVTTAAGFLCFHAGEIPAVDDHVIVHDHDFVVLEADERRVLRMKAAAVVGGGVGAAGVERDRAVADGGPASGGAVSRWCRVRRLTGALQAV